MTLFPINEKKVAAQVFCFLFFMGKEARNISPELCDCGLEEWSFGAGHTGFPFCFYHLLVSYMT